MKLLLIGAGPLPDDTDGVASASGLRTQQFLDGLPPGEDVTLVVVHNSGSTVEKRVEGVSQLRRIDVAKDDPHLFRKVRKIIREATPEAVIGINTFPSLVAAECVADKTPFWADLNGWALAEVQAQAAVRGSNLPLWQARRMETTIVRRADKISVVSTPQQYATYGELALLGRLDKDSFGYPLVEVVENSCRPLTEAEKHAPQKVFRGKRVPNEAILVLWLGGFNAWADEKTLFEGITEAIAHEPRLQLMVTGGSLAGIDETTFPRFRERVEASHIRDHVHFCGWLPLGELRSLLHETDIGINVDRICAETMMGARNRLNEMMRFGIPIVTTDGSEIARVLAEHGAALVAPCGDASQIAAQLLHLAGNIEERKRQQEWQEHLIKKRFYATIVQKPVIRWLTNTQCAPDRHQTKQSGVLMLPRSGLDYLHRRGMRAFWRRLRQYVNEIIA